jgi:hypothetical protein
LLCELCQGILRGVSSYGSFGSQALVCLGLGRTSGVSCVVVCSGEGDGFARMVGGGMICELGHLYVGMSTFGFLDVVGTEKEMIGSLLYVYDEDFAALALLGRGAVEAEPLHWAVPWTMGSSP